MSKRLKLGLAIGGALVALALLGAGGVYAATQLNGNARQAAAGQQAASATATPGKGAKAHRGLGLGPLQRLIAGATQGTLVVKDPSAPGGWVTMAFYRGKLTSVDTATQQITLQEANGTTQSFTLSASTQIRLGTGTGTIGDLHTGMETLVVTRQPQGGSAAVQMVYARAPKRAPSGAASTPAPGI